MIILPQCPVPTCRTPSLRRYSYNSQTPPLPPRPKSRRNSTTLPSLQPKPATPFAGMSSRYTRPASPRGRYANPARSSTGTFDPYYDATYYGRPSSPRTSGERVSGSHYSGHTYAPSTSTGSRTSNLKYDSYSGRPRRNTLTESEDRTIWPNVGPTTTTVLPTRTHSSHAHRERPSSPLTRSRDNRGDTYITHGGAPQRREHKRIYSVDDNSHKAKLIAEKDIVEPRRRDTEERNYSLTSGGRTYQQHQPSLRASDVGDEGYSYTDPASMYRDTEPAWRRPRSGSVERSSRPTSLIVDRAPRSSARELGPPPSTRGFDKINNTVGRSGSRHRGSSPSLDRPRDIPKYDPYPEALPPRPASTTYHAPAIHQDPRRDSYRSDYGRPDRDVENRRYAPVDQFDTDVSKRGFGIASPIVGHAPDPSYDRQSPWVAPEPPRTRPTDLGNPYYPPENRAEVRMPEQRLPRERDTASTYDERPRERDRDRRDSNHVIPSSTVPIVAGAATGAAATLGAAGLLKSRNKDRDSERDRERELEKEREQRRELEKEREQRREWDERDRRDRVPDERRDDRRERVPDDRRVVEERRDRAPEERRDRALEGRRDAPEERRDRGPEDRRERIPEERRDRAPEERLPPAAAAYAPTHDAERKPRDRHYENDDRDRRSRKAPSSEGSGDERPRHYVDPASTREPDRRKDTPPKDAPLNPDEEYRRRIQQEAERSGRARDQGDSDREKERHRRREERDKSREHSDEPRPRGPPSNVAEPSRSRFDDRSSHVLDSDIVQEPDTITKEQQQPGRAVQIVTPPKEPNPQPKGILRKPTAKFPEEPEPIREGVAPHKSQMKGKDIPINARWTKIDRKLVNPEALDEAKERFEERLDCVIVLRVLTKQEIQKLADRTRAIRETREDEYERGDRDQHDHHDRDRRSRRNHRDEDDRDRRRDYDDSDVDDIGRDRERERDRPRMIEDGR